MLTGPAMAAVAIMGMLAGSHARRTRATIDNEKAFFIAEAGVHLAAQHVANGGIAPTTLTGSLGDGEYHVSILRQSPATGPGGTAVQGTIRLNPNNSPNMSFFAELEDGTLITRQDLLAGIPDYEGPATRVHFRPMGGGNQSTLQVDGQTYTIVNNTVYDIQSSSMTIRLYNEHPNKAMGHWYLDIQSNNASFNDGSDDELSARFARYEVLSEGHVNGTVRGINIEGLRAMHWARFAFWYDTEALDLWFVGGERFAGAVHSNREMRFHSHNVNLLGQTHFEDRVTTTHNSIRVQNSSVNPVFDRGISLGVPHQDTTAISFPEMRGDAALVLQGETDIGIIGTNLVVSNARQGWTDHMMPIPDEETIYVETATTGANASRPGNVNVSAPDGLEGRLTIIAERDIRIRDHIRYQTDPVQHPESRDALGLVARRHVTVETDAPDDLDIFAHIIAAEGGFGVVDYNDTQRGPRGTLNVYGGIVNNVRQAVGTTAGAGYAKNYVYDTRFLIEPPPGYPVLPHAYEWTRWRDH